MPSTSPFLNFGRAALLGLTGGERSCDSAYPRCPRNEDDILYYLNNHRGGFFRFFNGGAAFGEEDDSNYNSQPQYQTQGGQYHQYPAHQTHNQQSGLNLATIQNLAEIINNSPGINLSNLGSNLGLLSNLASLMNGGAGQISSQTSQTQTHDSNSGIGDFVGNLLTGLVGNRFTSRKINKRSIDELYDINHFNSKKHGFSRKRNLNSQLVDPFQTIPSRKRQSIDYGNETDYNLITFLKYLGYELRNANYKQIKPEAQRRILNLNQPQIPTNNFFPYSTSNNVYGNYDENNVLKNLKLPGYGTIINYPTSPLNSHITQNLKFPHNFDETNYQTENTFKDISDVRYTPSRMIFPDRTGTGNFRFDNNQFEKYNSANKDHLSFEKFEPQFYKVDLIQKPVRKYQSHTNYNKYSKPNRPAYQYTKYKENDSNIYVTNGNGVIEYYINANGDKIFT